MRMNARGGPHALAAFGDLQAGAQMLGAARATNGQNVLHVAGAGALENLLAVGVEIGKLKMGVGVSKHESSWIAIQGKPGSA